MDHECQGFRAKPAAKRAEVELPVKARCAAAGEIQGVDFTLLRLDP
jgi:hypothetical protein